MTKWDKRFLDLATHVATWSRDPVSLTQLTDSDMKKQGARCWKHRRAPNLNGSLGDHVMAKRQLPSPEVLRQRLRYEPETGRLFWRHCQDRGPHWNARYADKPAFTADNGMGYRTGRLNRQQFQAHRVIWAIVNGEWPDDEIDHINGDRADNRLHNLRAVDRRGNMTNLALRTDNTSGVVGVYWARDRGKWAAQINDGTKMKSLGRFESFDAAVAARKAAEAEIGFHPNHGRSK